MENISNKAIINKSAKLGNNVKIYPNAIIDEDVIIGDNTIINSNAIIRSGARIGKNCEIFPGAIISEVCQDLKFNGMKTYAYIGDGTIIREYATIHRGTQDRGETVIGKNCLIMAYVHIAHDCLLRDNVIISNLSQIAGHVTIENYVTISGMVPVHQFTKLGSHSFIGGGYRVSKDVPPYILAAGEPLQYKGLNVVGLRRRGFSNEKIKELKNIYKVIYRSKYNTKDAIKYIENNFQLTDESKHIVDFIKNSERGIL
ncbi:MAG: acyl-ACP--UDP-N-acetylglucosamine O-acyltransferase [Candidatus Marinimicrobia bacterium]|nr:acyl-ACP--UDP-N-acetylglucosamine O-acyltransferase [Candidatus Neomarinimicrobiota bacterium]